MAKDPIGRDEFKEDLKAALEPLISSGEATATGLKTVSERTIEIGANQKHIQASLNQIDARLTAGDEKFERQAVDHATLSQRVTNHDERWKTHDRRSVGGGTLAGLSVVAVIEGIRASIARWFSGG